MNSDRSRSSGYELELQKFWLYKEKVSTKKIIRHWNRLPRDAAESVSLEILEIQQDMVLGNCPNWICFNKGVWTRWQAGSPSNTNYSVMLCLFLMIIMLLLLLLCNAIILCKESIAELKCSTEPSNNNSLLSLLCLLQLSHPSLPELLLFAA